MHRGFWSFAVPLLAAAAAFADGTGPGGRPSGLNDVREVKNDADTWMCDGGLRRSTGMAGFARV